MGNLLAISGTMDGVGMSDSFLAGYTLECYGGCDGLLMGHCLEKLMAYMGCLVWKCQ